MPQILPSQGPTTAAFFCVLVLPCSATQVSPSHQCQRHPIAPACRSHTGACGVPGPFQGPFAEEAIPGSLFLI